MLAFVGIVAEVGLYHVLVATFGAPQESLPHAATGYRARTGWFRAIVCPSLSLLAIPAMAQSPGRADPPLPRAAASANESGAPTLLREALLAVYESNPELAAARAAQHAVIENVPIAEAAGLPGILSSGSLNQALYNTGRASGPLRRNAGLTLSVPIYSGGAVRNAVGAAAKRTEAGNADLRRIEAAVLARAATAYVDVLRDEAVVDLNRNNARALETNLRGTRDRFEVGDLTRTDVAQSEARLALARGRLATAEARLAGSRQGYAQVVGMPPGTLVWPPELPGLPGDVGSAQQVALVRNPELQAARSDEDAARFDIGVAKAGRLPRFSLGANSSYGNAPAAAARSTPGLGRGGGPAFVPNSQASFPIYQGGRPAAQVRQAAAWQVAAVENATTVERRVITQVRTAFANRHTALAVINASRTAVDANRLSLEGVRAEHGVGNRSVLDVLNAEQELLNAEVQLVVARREAYVADLALLAAMGRAGASDLGLVEPAPRIAATADDNAPHDDAAF